MEAIKKKLNADLAVAVMAREDARRMYQGAQKEEKIAYYSGKIEYIQELLETIAKSE